MTTVTSATKGKKRVIRRVMLSFIALAALTLLRDVGNATINLCPGGADGLRTYVADPNSRCGVVLGPFPIATLYTSAEVDKALAAQAAAQAAQLNQLEAKMAQDEQQLKESLQTDLENSVGLVLTPALLKQIQDAAATDALNRVLTTLRAQGVIH